MILPTMTQDELDKNIWSDFELINSKYVPKLMKQYDKLRTKNKVRKEVDFQKIVEIKTPSKNNWILFLGKAPSDNAYKGTSSIVVGAYCYYYTNIGIRVFNVQFPHRLSVYNAHFFTRYNERMNLNLSSPLDKIKHYFLHNGWMLSQTVITDEIIFFIGTVKDGFALGESQFNDTWHVFKTFIPKGIAWSDQSSIEKDLIESLKKDIENSLNQPSFDRVSYNYKVDLLKGITS